jgi:hypothetical protein
MQQPARREAPVATAVAREAAPATPLRPAVEPVAAAARRTVLPEAVAVATSGTDLSAVEQARRELHRREMQVQQREAELAEQRRVLAEEYRLLRAQRAAPAVVPAEGTFRFQVAGGAPTAFDKLMGDRFDTERSETFWTRLKRFMLGVSPS